MSPGLVELASVNYILRDSKSSGSTPLPSILSFSSVQKESFI